MFDTILLLTDTIEQSLFRSLLLDCNSALEVISIVTAAELSEVAPAVLQRARLIAFGTPIIVPGCILDWLGYGAYNFHPGPPEYPGWAPAHFALYDRATAFGVTAHAMVEKVDAGPIVDVDRFEIPACCSVVFLEALAYARLAGQFRRLLRSLATQAGPLATVPVRWSGRKNTRRRFAAMCNIPLDLSGDEFERRLAIFGNDMAGTSMPPGFSRIAKRA